MGSQNLLLEILERGKKQAATFKPAVLELYGICE